MTGEGSQASNDPEGIRNAMVRVMLDHLYTLGVLNNITHRLGVVSFGSTARLDLRLPTSLITEDSIDELRREVDTLGQQDSMGNTHFLAAFRMAAEQFLDADRYASRKRAVLLITDGSPYVDEIQLDEYEEELRKFVRSEFPHPGFLIKVVALNDEESDYWERYRSLWQDLSNNNARKLAGNKEQIFKALLEEFAGLVGAAAEHVPETSYERLPIPPYLESVAFNIFSLDPEARVEIFTHSSAVPLSEDDPNVEMIGAGKYITTISIKEPEPGEWRIQKVNDAKVEIFRQLFFPRGELLRPEPEKELRQFEMAPVVYRVLNGTGEPLQEKEAYPLTLEIALVKPDESILRYEMIRAPDLGEAVFQTPETIEYDLAGSYRTEVSISTRDIRNTPVTIFRDQFSGFTVSGASRIDCLVEAPAELATIPLYRSLVLWPNPIEVHFEFVDEQEQPINLPAVFKPPLEELLDLQFEVEGQQVDGATIELEDLGEGVLAGQVRGLSRPGRYQLTVSADKAHLPARYSVRVVPSQVTFERKLLPIHWLQLLALGAVVLVVLGAGLRTTFLNLRAPLKGELFLDRLGGTQIGEYPLNPRRHRMVIKDLPHQTQIKKILVRSRRGSTPGVVVTVIAENKKQLLKERTILNRGNAQLEGAPYVLKYRTDLKT